MLEQGACTTPQVASEVAKGRAGRDRDLLLERGLVVREPSRGALERVNAAASRTGDSGRVSGADVGVLALALDTGGEVVSDDYSIQNLARAMGIPCRGLAQRGISREIAWAHRCRGCRREYPGPMRECPVCGSPVESKRAMLPGGRAGRRGAGEKAK